MKNLVMIGVDKLAPHPDNPRKNLGDLTELMDSIKAVGIMQNLTVVPFEDTYRILIGHRRHAAAKKAGLAELPCAIVNIPPEKQVEIMLIENMQRSDLTVLEEAKGLQMMVEMGNSIKDICGKTGFSESKVRHRVKMGELNQELLQQKFDECQSISIMDLQKLEQIKDPILRDGALKYIGTANFEQKVRSAMDEEKYQEWERNLLTQTGDIPLIDNTDGKSYFANFCDYTDPAQALAKIKSYEGNLYRKKSYRGFSIYIDTPQSQLDEEAKVKEKSRVMEEREKAIFDVLKRMKHMRRDFIRELSNRDCGYLLFHTPKVQKFLLSSIGTGDLDFPDLLDMLGIKIEKEPNPWDTEKWEELVAKSVDETNIKKALLCGLYLTLEPNRYDRICNYQAEFTGNKKYKNIYDFMKIAGYQMSDEEKQIIDGTHELYMRRDENE